MGTKVAKQLELELSTWGGRRVNAGRKCGGRASVAHVVRPTIAIWGPVLITMRMHESLPGLRSRPAWAAIVRAFRASRTSPRVSFVHYSVLSNHLHAIAECSGREALARGMQSFATRLGIALNRHFARRGPVFASRYHARALTTPSEVRNALRYVLLNARHHAHEAGMILPCDWVDPRSTAATFDGWTQAPCLREREADFGSSPARSWLLRTGWRKHGALALDEIPGLRLRGAANERRGPAIAA
jgi:hypothetical protein